MFLCLYEAQISGERLQHNWSSGLNLIDKRHLEKIIGMGHIVSEMIISKYINK